MTPEEIEAAEFFVGMRGYERAEVRAFLNALAEEHRTLLARVAELEAGAPVAAEAEVDPVEQLGEHVAGVVRAAREAAEALVQEAEQRGAAVTGEAEARRAEADRLLEEARTEAERLRREATEQGQAAADALVGAAEAERDRIKAVCDEMLTKLNDAVTGAQMAVLVLRSEGEGGTGDAAIDLREGAEPAPAEEAWQG